MQKAKRDPRTEPQFESSSAAEARHGLIAQMPVTERRVTLAGLSTAVLEGGSGPPLVLLHGPLGNATHWLRVIPRLAADHRVIAPDLPGHGATDAGALETDRVLDWLGALIEQTCVEPPIVVAQTVGGAIALRFAARHGERLRRLVLIDTFGLAQFQPVPEFGRALAEFLDGPDHDTHHALWRRCAFNLDGVLRGMGERWALFEAYNLDRARTPSVLAAVGALIERFGGALPEDELARIAVPTTLIWGEHDLATPLAVANAASARYGWPLTVIANCADDPPIEQPDALVDAIAAGGTRDAQTDAIRDAWDKIAPGYGRIVGPTHEWLGAEGLRRAGLAAGMRFLDVAAGSGALSLPAARLGARVLATDLSPVMLKQLDARAAKEGLAIETRVMDGTALDLADGSFDMAGSQFGVMLFPDMPRGIRELARVVKPGGRVLMTVFGDVRRVEFFAFFVAALQSVVPSFAGPPMDPPPLPFQLQDPARLRRELAEAGLKDIRVEPTTEPLEFSSGPAMWDWLVNSNPVVGVVLGGLNLGPAEIQKAIAALDRKLRERATGSASATLTSPINIGIGTK